MRKIIGCATSWTFLHLMECVRTFISFSGSTRLCPLYLKLSKATHVLIADASSEQEGLGATYDKRKWNESYYGKPRSKNKLFVR